MRWTGLLGALCAAALIAAGCNEEPEGLACGELKPGKRPATGDLDGSLVISPGTIAPGGKVRYRVKNEGAVDLAYGADVRADRMHDGGWVSAEKQIFEGRNGVIAIGYGAAPGELGARETLLLPEDVDSGTYRLRKTVSDRLRAGGPKLGVCDVFEVA